MERTMLNLVPPTDCTIARQAASARLDGEIAPLDSARLDAHLRDCAGCQAYAASLAGFTADLRRTPLEPHSVELRLSRRRRRIPGSAAVAAAVVLVSVAASSYAVGRELGGQATRTATTPAAVDAALL